MTNTNSADHTCRGDRPLLIGGRERLILSSYTLSFSIQYSVFSIQYSVFSIQYSIKYCIWILTAHTLVSQAAALEFGEKGSLGIRGRLLARLHTYTHIRTYLQFSPEPALVTTHTIHNARDILEVSPKLILHKQHTCSHQRSYVLQVHTSSVYE